MLRWCEDLLRGLVFLESHCVAHRDLKMDNLLLSRNGKVVIADFGKAIILNDKMETPYMHGGCLVVCVCVGGIVCVYVRIDQCIH